MFTRICLPLFFILTTTIHAQTPLAKNGKAQQTIIVPAKSSARVKMAADNLARYLSRMSGGEFPIEPGSGKTGIVVGRLNDFPQLVTDVRWDADKDVTQRENYLLRSHEKGVYILGATDLAVEHAVWDLLYRLGYRQFFPGKTWEVVPTSPDLSIRVDVKETPDYYSRRIWYGYGTWGYNNEPYKDWCAKNRVTQGIRLNTGHAYSGLIRGNQKIFDEHPEFYALRDGKRHKSHFAQLCLSNEDLRRVIVAHALRHFSKNPDSDSISMDPNDGDRWCQCQACAKFGTVSDRVVTLANEVAAGVNKKFPGKLVGMYAYASHSPPPNIRVHPKVVVSVATSFLRGGYTLDELLAGWSKQGATLGIREYYSVHTWDRDMPGKSRGSNLDYLKRSIPYFHGKGARYLSAESSDNWGPNGLGYYLAGRMLWDVNEAERAEEIVDDFLSKAFAEAREPMREFYQLIDGSKTHLVFDDRLGKMFRCLDRAKKLAKTPGVKARINELLLYCHYADSFDRYRQAKGEERQRIFEDLIRFSYRMRGTMLIHAKAVYRDINNRDKNVSIPKEAGWTIPEARNPWKSSKPFSPSELDRFLAEGLQGRQISKLDFTPITFATDLRPTTNLKLATVKPGTTHRGRGQQTFYTWIDKAPGKLQLNITGGLIAHYRDRGNVRVNVYHMGKQETLVAEDRSVPPDGKQRTIRLQIKTSGLHKITIADGGDMTAVTWPDGTPMTYKSGVEGAPRLTGRFSLYFYVPKGTKKVGLFASGQGSVLNATGKKVLAFSGPGEYFSIPVQPEQSGTLWKIQHTAGQVRLLNVPPYLARSERELLLPSDVLRGQ